MIEDSIREFLLTDLGVGLPAKELTNDRSLLASGLVDSLAVLQVVEFIEERFGVTLDLEDLTGDNFDSVSAIAALVRAHDH